eukprot:1136784-Pelagomonas_calceolata.AAC.4
MNINAHIYPYNARAMMRVGLALIRPTKSEQSPAKAHLNSHQSEQSEHRRGASCLIKWGEKREEVCHAFVLFCTHRGMRELGPGSSTMSSAILTLITSQGGNTSQGPRSRLTRGTTHLEHRSLGLENITGRKHKPAPQESLKQRDHAP